MFTTLVNASTAIASGFLGDFEIKTVNEHDVSGGNAAHWISDFHLQTLSELASLSGLTGNQLLIAANDETLRRTGLLTALLPGPTHFLAPGGERYFTPTQLGRPYGMSAQKLNKLLEARGLQVKRFGEWSMTPLGSSYGVMLDTSKRHHSGTLVQQLKWRATVLDVLDLAG